MVREMRDALAIAIEEAPATFWRRILVPWALALMTIVASVELRP
jgi:hypothetical protein